MRVTPSCTRCACLHVYTCVAQEKKMGIPAWGEAPALSEPLAHQGHGDLKQGAAGSGREQSCISALGVASSKLETPSHCGFSMGQTAGSGPAPHLLPVSPWESLTSRASVSSSVP